MSKVRSIAHHFNPTPEHIDNLYDVCNGSRYSLWRLGVKLMRATYSRGAIIELIRNAIEGALIATCQHHRKRGVAVVVINEEEEQTLTAAIAQRIPLMNPEQKPIYAASLLQGLKNMLSDPTVDRHSSSTVPPFDATGMGGSRSARTNLFDQPIPRKESACVQHQR